jgi:ABC-2 type transport system permease protein
MHTLLVLLRKDFTNFFRNKAAVSLTFIVPFVMIYIFGQVFGVTRPDRGPSDIPLAVVNASEHPAAARLVQSLQAEDTFKVITRTSPEVEAGRLLTIEDFRPMMRANSFRFAVVIPNDFMSPDRVGLRLRIFSNPRNEIETQMVNGLLQKTIFSNAPELLSQSLQAAGQARVGIDAMKGFNRTLAEAVATTFGTNPDEVVSAIEQGTLDIGTLGGSTGANDFLAQIVQIETEQVIGQDVKSPAATRIVSGFAIQFLLFALSSSAAALFYERDRGIFQRILAGPVRRSQILWSKFIYGAVLGLVQLTVLFIAGRVLYGIDVENHLGMLTLVCLTVAAACTAFGMLLASICNTVEAANGLATFVILLMCSVGGAWFPVSLMPEFVQHLSKLTLVYWAMEGFDQVLWLDASVLELLPSLSVLVAIAAIVMSIAVWRFNRSALFE